MPTITIPRPDLRAEDVCAALRAGLGEHYNVLPRMRIPQNCIANPSPGGPDEIVVATGSNHPIRAHLIRAQVTLIRRSGQTQVRIRPGGTSWEFPINWFGIARKIREALLDVPSLQ